MESCEIVFEIARYLKSLGILAPAAVPRQTRAIRRPCPGAAAKGAPAALKAGLIAFVYVLVYVVYTCLSDQAGSGKTRGSLHLL